MRGHHEADSSGIRASIAWTTTTTAQGPRRHRCGVEWHLPMRRPKSCCRQKCRTTCLCPQIKSDLSKNCSPRGTTMEDHEIRYSKTSSIAVGATRIRNFGATLSRRSWDGCCRARQVVTGRNSGVRHNVQCCAEEEVGRRNMAGQDALARASSTPRTDPGTLRASARTAPWRMLTEADRTCG
jgi:hypothetical protein